MAGPLPSLLPKKNLTLGDLAVSLLTMMNRYVIIIIIGVSFFLSFFLSQDESHEIGDDEIKKYTKCIEDHVLPCIVSS